MATQEALVCVPPPPNAAGKIQSRWWFWTLISAALCLGAFLCLFVLLASIGVSVSGGGGHVDEKPFVLVTASLLGGALGALGASAFFAWRFRPFSGIAALLAFGLINGLLLTYVLAVGAFVFSI